MVWVSFVICELGNHFHITTASEEDIQKLFEIYDACFSYKY